MKFKYYFVAHKDKPEEILAIVETKDQAKEFIENTLLLSHLNDFKSWCYYNQKAEDDNSWQEYITTRISKEKKNCYVIGQKGFDKKMIAAILRMFIGCQPKGCSYETTEEYTYFGQKLMDKKRIIEKLQKMSQEQLKKYQERFEDVLKDDSTEKKKDDEVDSKDVQ